MFKKILLLTLILSMAMCLPVRAEGPCTELDLALSMLEQGNPFFVRYRELCSPELENRFELGCPYFFGGRSYARILQPYQAWQSSVYYKAGNLYLGGFDCSGFTKWVMKESKRGEHPALDDLLHSADHTDRMMKALDQVPTECLWAFLEPGDLMGIVHAGGNMHIMMYIGTLSDFGYREEDVPEKLQGFLHYPLMIHCAANMDYTLRYRKYIAGRYETVLPPDGGVMVSILNAPETDADGLMQNADGSYRFFYELEGYRLTVYNTAREHRAVWIRWGRN